MKTRVPDGDRIRIAEPGDYILGIVSGSPCIVGNGDEDWLGRYVRDDFGRIVKETVETPVVEEIEVEVTDEDGNIRVETQEVETGDVTVGWDYKVNPDYDPEQVYIQRKDRVEWDAVGMMGVLTVIDDGTCEVNGFAKVSSGGIATAAEKHVYGETYRVISRINKQVVKVVFR